MIFILELQSCQRALGFFNALWCKLNPINLSNGFLPSTSTEICDEIALVFPRVIAEGPIPLEKQGQDHAKIVDVERIKPITQVNMRIIIFFVTNVKFFVTIHHSPL